MDRPFQRKTTKELSTLFESSRNFREILEQLSEELTHRRVPAAVALKTRVAAALAQAKAVTDVMPSLDEPESPIEPPANASTYKDAASE
jgi:benzoyl-CoA reductase/2-hydroxyglutaryl-CoA dehydratase subunit BcrC/BadD/HgdB